MLHSCQERNCMEETEHFLMTNGEYFRFLFLKSFSNTVNAIFMLIKLNERGESEADNSVRSN